MEARAHLAEGADGELVAEVVEAEFGADAVGDVARVGRLFRGAGRSFGEKAHGHAEPLKRRAGELAIAFREIAVHGGDVRAAAFEREAERGQQRDERLAFAGGHLAEMPRGEDVAGVELHVVGHEVMRATDGLGDERDGFDV